MLEAFIDISKVSRRWHTVTGAWTEGFLAIGHELVFAIASMPIL